MTTGAGRRRSADAALLTEVREFIASRRLLCVASLTPGGYPHASTAPFLAADGYFYLLISELSEHTAILKENDRASVLFAADECDTIQPFARLRVTFRVTAKQIGREQPLWRKRIEQMRARFGPIVDQLAALPDFLLFELTPASGSYVKGFSEAYTLEGLGRSTP